MKQSFPLSSSKMTSPIDPEALLAQLTLEEKIQLTAGSDLWRTVQIERLKIPFIKLTDGPIGARGGGDFHDSTPSTLFPSPSCLGSTWDKELAFEMGKQIALDSIEKQCHVLLGPTINGQRDPRAGRFFESYSEDPTLMGLLASFWIKGCQSCGVGATMKHFVANEAEFDRRNNSSDLSIESLREIYLEPFRIIMADMQRNPTSPNDPFKSQPACVMTAYNRVNGISSSENDAMINEILRKEWGFDGLVMSDWFAMHANAFNATDLEMPGPTIFRTIEKTIELIQKNDEKGKKMAKDLDRCVLKVLELIKKVYKLGYQKSVKDEIEKSIPIQQVEPAIRKIGAEGAVLLKNDNDILPIIPKKNLKILCVGAPWIDAVQSGGGSANLTAQKVMQPLSTFKDAMKKEAGGEGVVIKHHNGVGIHNFVKPLEKSIKLDFLTGRQPGQGEIVASSIGQKATLSTMMPKPKEVPWNNYWVRGSLEIDSIEKDCQLRFGTLGLGTITIYLTIDNDKSTQSIWNFDGETDLFESIVNPLRKWQENIITVKANQKIQIEVHFVPRLVGEEHGNAKYGGFQIGMEEVEDEDNLISQAVQQAKEVDLTIIMTALGKDWESEGFDRSNIFLPRRQDDLVNQITKSCPGKTIILNLTGSVVGMPWRKDATGIVQCWYGGQEGAVSLSDILLGRGEAPASGRLAHVWSDKIEDHPSGVDDAYFPGVHLPNDKEGPHTNYIEGRLVGYKYYNKHKNANQPAFHFGEGLGGYTTFQTEGPFLDESTKISKSSLPLLLKVKSTNTGKRSGKEIAQIYLRPHVPLSDAKDEPIQRLVGFAVLRPTPGQSEEGEIELYQDAFSHWDEKSHSWQVKEGDYDLVLARSARYGDELGKITVSIDQSWSWTGTGVE